MAHNVESPPVRAGGLPEDCLAGRLDGFQIRQAPAKSQAHLAWRDRYVELASAITRLTDVEQISEILLQEGCERIRRMGFELHESGEVQDLVSVSRAISSALDILTRLRRDLA